MLFIHGFGTDQTVWTGVAAAFTEAFRVVRFDNAGAGPRADEFRQSDYLGLRAYAGDALRVARALDLRDVVVVGHSAGAMVGLLAAVAEPDRFSALTLISASPRYLDDEGYRGGFTKDDLDRLYSAMMADYGGWADEFALAAMRNGQRPQLALRFAEALKAIPPERALTVLCSIFQSDHRADLAGVKCPTLIIQSSEDLAVPVDVAHYLRMNIEDSELALIEAMGHLPHVSAPDAVAEAVRGFLAKRGLLGG